MNKKIFYLLLILVFGCFFFTECFDVYAGEINSAEQQVISAASGTFNYEGGVYKAYDEYVAELRNYFMRDDVNLDQSEVSGLIRDMNNSVADGVNAGYLYKIGGDNPVDKKEDKKNQTFEDDDEWEDMDIDPKSPKKSFDVQKSIENNKIFYVDDETNESVEVNLVIKNTGYDVSRLIKIAIGFMVLLVSALYLCVRYDLFAPTEES